MKLKIILILLFTCFFNISAQAEEVYVKSLVITLVRGGNIVYNNRNYQLYAVAKFSDGTNRVVTGETAFKTNYDSFEITGGSVLSIPSVAPDVSIPFKVFGGFTFNGVKKVGGLSLTAQYKPIITDITIYGPTTVPAGQTAYYTARAFYDDNTNKMITAMYGVSWSTDDSTIGYFTQPGTLKTMSNIWGTNPLEITISVNDDGRWSYEYYDINVIYF